MKIIISCSFSKYDSAVSVGSEARVFDLTREVPSLSAADSWSWGCRALWTLAWWGQHNTADNPGWPGQQRNTVVMTERGQIQRPKYGVKAVKQKLSMWELDNKKPDPGYLNNSMLHSCHRLTWVCTALYPDVLFTSKLVSQRPLWVSQLK